MNQLESLQLTGQIESMEHVIALAESAIQAGDSLKANSHLTELERSLATLPNQWLRVAWANRIGNARQSLAESNPHYAESVSNERIK